MGMDNVVLFICLHQTEYQPSGIGIFIYLIVVVVIQVII
nr:MAG TPA: hypothetical protein [Caudoviricetes sp.]